MQRNWRAKAARIQFFFGEGSVALTQFKQVVYVAAALKIFEVPLWAIVLLSPAIYALHVLVGYFWVHYGWFKQVREVTSVDAISPMEMWTWHMNIKLYKQMGLTLDDMDLKTMPPELKRVFASFQQEAK